ncbi:MAG: RdgB/HAM1 family non-canonical purine NTP pyrophosphatase [Flavobacteriaceae bacterium TMED238]|nr:non-canonical purine NTP pyrophosphatase, RdgB/HAM1 family [Flavobacteriales bacterium]RPG62934.1 MAG: RdgB/HAM1 family non-canonical purine NTP pyrophosphatase [Flavobacteriaceae bacterium TMED238]
MELIIATHNENKVLEFKKKLSSKYLLKSLHDLNFKDSIPENENSIKKNAIFKSKFVHNIFKSNVFSDDTGLEIESLDNEPGVNSARYSGEKKDSLKNIELVLKKMKGVLNRKARFRTTISLIIDNKNYCFEGIVNGTIIDTPKGDMGFGYDPIFVANNMKKTFAEITLSEKNKISHRAIATNKLIDFLNKKVF